MSVIKGEERGHLSGLCVATTVKETVATALLATPLQMLPNNVITSGFIGNQTIKRSLVVLRRAIVWLYKSCKRYVSRMYSFGGGS